MDLRTCEEIVFVSRASGQLGLVYEIFSRK
jgi:hypothetical protein